MRRALKNTFRLTPVPCLRRIPLSRRTVLRGLFAGATVSVALPPLDIFFDTNGEAYADGTGFPKRFGLWFWGNGILPEYWTPLVTGEGWSPSPLLEPLAGLTNEITVISGLEVKVANLKPHGSGPGGFLSGTDLKIAGEDETFRAPSLDQLIAQAIGGDTVYRSVEVGVAPGTGGRSYNGSDSKNPPELEPKALFERLFGASFTAPGEEAIIDPRLALRRSVLDSVMADAASVRDRLGQGDRERLEQHLDAIRDIEKRLIKLETEPPSFAACHRPSIPSDYPDIDGRPQMDARNAIASDLIAMAYACDLTRVVSIWHSDPVSDVLYEGASAGHHQLTHDEPGEQIQVQGIVKRIMGHFGTFVDALRNIPEGDRTLLDNCVILGTSDVGFARTHQIDEFPILLAGTASGYLKRGVHIRSDIKENASRVPLTLMQAMGMPVASFGEGDAYVETGLKEVVA